MHSTHPGLSIISYGLMGFLNPVSITVILSGSHSVGKSRDPQPGTCRPINTGEHTLSNDADAETFGNHYYKEVVLQTGKMVSDAHGTIS
jgi:hypothetical protein